MCFCHNQVLNQRLCHLDQGIYRKRYIPCLDHTTSCSVLLSTWLKCCVFYCSLLDTCFLDEFGECKPWHVWAHRYWVVHSQPVSLRSISSYDYLCNMSTPQCKPHQLFHMLRHVGSSTC